MEVPVRALLRRRKSPSAIGSPNAVPQLTPAGAGYAHIARIDRESKTAFCISRWPCELGFAKIRQLQRHRNPARKPGATDLLNEMVAARRFRPILLGS